MMKLTKKEIAIASKVKEFIIRVDSLNGCPVVSICHPSLRGVVGIFFPDQKEGVAVGDHRLVVDDEGNLVATIAWISGYDEEGDEVVTTENEVDVTELVTARVSIDDPCMENFRSAIEHPEWHEYYMSKRSFKFLQKIFCKEEDGGDASESEEEE